MAAFKRWTPSPRAFRKGDRVHLRGQLGKVADRPYDVPGKGVMVPVQFDGISKLAWVSAGDLALTDAGSAPRVKSSASPRKDAAASGACSVCGDKDDHGGDGHPSYEDEEREPVERHVAWRKGLS